MMGKEVFMVLEINSDNAMLQMLLQMQTKMQSADVDGKIGLSKEELASITAGKDTGVSDFLKSLTEQFDELDEDKNGQLTTAEMSNVKKEQLGPPAGMFIEALNQKESDEKQNSSSSLVNINKRDSIEGLKDSIKDMTGTFVQKLFDSYKNGGLTNLASSLSSLV